jgi:tetratricopeptide (TPR) repeat protein
MDRERVGRSPRAAVITRKPLTSAQSDLSWKGMSRSIHTIERDLLEAPRVRCAHRRDFAEARAELRADLEKKRRIKRQVALERHAGPRPVGVSPEAIPIRASAPRAGVLHAASLEDTRAVLAALPPGVIDGLAGVELRLGTADQEDAGDDLPPGDRDPIMGRLGFEVLPGYWSGRVLGAYLPGSAIIEVYAYVRAEGAPFSEWVPLYLRLRALATLVHELGHHHDLMARVARGRWLADDAEKREVYAEGREHAWVRSVVVPYLEQAYPEERAALDAWLLRHGGLTLPLYDLLDDPRTTLMRGKKRLLFGMESALSALCEAVARGEPEDVTHVEMARELHYADRYVEARAVLAGVLARAPEHGPALVLGADIDVHEGHEERAAEVCRAVLSRDAADVEAWEVLAHAERARRRWAEARDAATAAIGLRPVGGPYWNAALRERARALLELGDHDALTVDLDALAQGNVVSRGLASALSAVSALRRGLFEEALTAARAGLAVAQVPFRAELAAAGFEAAQRLGRPEEAPPLPLSWGEALRRRGFEAWVDALVALGAR